ncbi:unnamed protein product [Anisakis simplex]|uniref:TPR repeat-containing protein n=1 Tax=Anisakis simplex TaxID=6269 RepID=A0A0M3J4H7_ANISI|nr:unnamed protein product [Anisakis simplex]
MERQWNFPADCSVLCGYGDKKGIWNSGATQFNAAIKFDSYESSWPEKLAQRYQLAQVRLMTDPDVAFLRLRRAIQIVR